MEGRVVLSVSGVWRAGFGGMSVRAGLLVQGMGMACENDSFFVLGGDLQKGLFCVCEVNLAI